MLKRVAITTVGISVGLFVTNGATPASEYSLDWYTIDGGGMMFTTGGGWELAGTIGQHDATLTTMTGGGWVYLESGFSMEAQRELTGMGHRIRTSLAGYGGYQAIRFDAANGVYFGASESRKDGMAAGY